MADTSCWCCKKDITVDGKSCELIDCYTNFDILIGNITKCVYQCGADRIVTVTRVRVLWWCFNVSVET